MAMLIGIDIGTTGTKTVLANEDGLVIEESYKGYPMYSEKSGCAEQEAEDWWDAVVLTVRDCIKGISDKNEICALALSSQGGSMLPVDENCTPLSRAVSWMDRRGSIQTEELLKDKGQDYFYYKTGWRLSNCLNLIQIKWLADNDPKHGGTHHGILVYNASAKVLKDFAELMGWEFVEI